MNILPVEVWDPPLEPVHAGAHLQPTICSVVRHGLELILQGAGGDLDGLLFPHTCDSIQNLASLVHDCLDDAPPCYFFYPPKTPAAPAARTYYLNQLEALAQSLRKRFGALDRNEFRRRVQQGQQIAARIQHLYDLRARNAVTASNAAFYRLVRSGEYLFADDIQVLVETAIRQSVPGPGRGPGVILSGVLPNPSGMLTLLDRYGVRIVEDDLLSCGRRLQAASTLPADPFDSLVEQYVNLPPCSTRNSSIQDRLETLLDKIDRTEAVGVIFSVVKFCEPELFDVPPLTTALKKRGIKTVVIEAEVGCGLTGQLATRLEAFIEMLAVG
jgi:benzoyl-CoA reductase/2-hydroxyglutaryl-CoA dehydratase subunit BcrC/BadD/HgdB